MLTLFSNVHNTRGLFKQDQLRSVFMKARKTPLSDAWTTFPPPSSFPPSLPPLQLLTHKETELQSLSLSCLATYKLPFLLPYKWVTMAPSVAAARLPVSPVQGTPGGAAGRCCLPGGAGLLQVRACRAARAAGVAGA